MCKGGLEKKMTLGPGKMMEEYIESGSYKLMKELSLERDAINQNIYDHLIEHEAKRHEISCNLVAKFITRNVFQYDYAGLNEYLHDHGLLQRLVKLSSRHLKNQEDLLDLFAPYRLKPEFYTKPSFNKAGREMVNIEKPPELHLSLGDAAKKKRANMLALRTAKLEYENVKTRIAQSKELLNGQKVKHKYGSLSRVQKPLSYDVRKITEGQVIDKLIQYGKPDIARLESYMIRGFISKSKVESFRELTDIKLELVILDINEEAALMNIYYQKKFLNKIG